MRGLSSLLKKEHPSNFNEFRLVRRMQNQSLTSQVFGRKHREKSFSTSTGDINDRGEIAGSAFDQTIGTSPAFLAIPCNERHADDEGYLNGAHDRIAARRPHTALPETVGEQLRWRLRFRGYGILESADDRCSCLKNLLESN